MGYCVICGKRTRKMCWGCVIDTGQILPVCTTRRDCHQRLHQMRNEIQLTSNTTPLDNYIFCLFLQNLIMFENMVHFEAILLIKCTFYLDFVHFCPQRMTHLNLYLSQKSFSAYNIIQGTFLHLIEHFKSDIKLYGRKSIKIKGRP